MRFFSKLFGIAWLQQREFRRYDSDDAPYIPETIAALRSQITMTARVPAQAAVARGLAKCGTDTMSWVVLWWLAM